MWADGKIDSKTCLIKEFELVPNLSEKLINDFGGLKEENFILEKDNKLLIHHNYVRYELLSID